MSEEIWNKDAHYTFGLLKVGMCLNGTWPLLRKNLSAKLRWTIGALLVIVMHINLSIEVLQKNGSSNRAPEAAFFWVYMFVFEAKHFYTYHHAKLLEENVSSAIKDWRHSEQNEKWQTVMKQYSRRQKMSIICMITIGVTAVIIYQIVTFVSPFFKSVNYQPANDTDNDDPIRKERMYIVPSSWLDDKIGNTGYIFVCVWNIIWHFESLVDEIWTTCFFYTIVMHLAGQFEILGNEFSQFGCGIKTESALRRVLGTLVRRQYKLIKLADNLRVSFAEIIFMQLGLCATVLAVLGLRAIMNVKHGNHLELLNSMMIIGYLLLETGVYIYSADFLSLRSENIFHIINQIPWYELPRKVAKDLTFVMVRSENPVRLSGGKFFYVSRSTLMYIINTAISYVTVLNATVQT